MAKKNTGTIQRNLTLANEDEIKEYFRKKQEAKTQNNNTPSTNQRESALDPSYSNEIGGQETVDPRIKALNDLYGVNGPEKPLTQGSTDLGVGTGTNNEFPNVQPQTQPRQMTLADIVGWQDSLPHQMPEQKAADFVGNQTIADDINSQREQIRQTNPLYLSPDFQKTSELQQKFGDPTTMMAQPPSDGSITEWNKPEDSVTPDSRDMNDPIKQLRTIAAGNKKLTNMLTAQAPGTWSPAFSNEEYAQNNAITPEDKYLYDIAKLSTGENSKYGANMRLAKNYNFGQRVLGLANQAVQSVPFGVGETLKNTGIVPVTPVQKDIQQGSSVVQKVLFDVGAGLPAMLPYMLGGGAGVGAIDATLNYLANQLTAPDNEQKTLPEGITDIAAQTALFHYLPKIGAYKILGGSPTYLKNAVNWTGQILGQTSALTVDGAVKRVAQLMQQPGMDYTDAVEIAVKESKNPEKIASSFLTMAFAHTAAKIGQMSGEKELVSKISDIANDITGKVDINKNPLINTAQLEDIQKDIESPKQYAALDESIKKINDVNKQSAINGLMKHLAYAQTMGAPVDIEGIKNKFNVNNPEMKDFFDIYLDIAEQHNSTLVPKLNEGEKVFYQPPSEPVPAANIPSVTKASDIPPITEEAPLPEPIEEKRSPIQDMKSKRDALVASRREIFGIENSDDPLYMNNDRVNSAYEALKVSGGLPEQTNQPIPQQNNGVPNGQEKRQGRGLLSQERPSIDNVPVTPAQDIQEPTIDNSDIEGADTIPNFDRVEYEKIKNENRDAENFQTISPMRGDLSRIEKSISENGATTESIAKRDLLRELIAEKEAAKAQEPIDHAENRERKQPEQTPQDSISPKSAQFANELETAGIPKEAAAKGGVLLEKALTDKEIALDILHTGNKNYRAVWEKETGIKLPKTESGTKSAIADYFGKPKEDIKTDTKTIIPTSLEPFRALLEKKYGKLEDLSQPEVDNIKKKIDAAIKYTRSKEIGDLGFKPSESQKILETVTGKKGQAEKPTYVKAAKDWDLPKEERLAVIKTNGEKLKGLDQLAYGKKVGSAYSDKITSLIDSGDLEGAKTIADEFKTARTYLPDVGQKAFEATGIFSTFDKLNAKLAKQPAKDTLIGNNNEGHPVYEDKNKVRYVVRGGVKVTEPVSMIPTREGLVISVSPLGQKDEQFLTKDEVQAKKPNNPLSELTQRRDAKIPVTKKPTIIDDEMDSLIDDLTNFSVKPLRPINVYKPGQEPANYNVKPLNPEQMQKGIALVNHFLDKDVYKFEDMIQQIYDKRGLPIVEKIFDSMKRAYAASHITADKSAIDKMTKYSYLQAYSLDDFKKGTESEQQLNSDDRGEDTPAGQNLNSAGSSEGRETNGGDQRSGLGERPEAGLGQAEEGIRNPELYSEGHSRPDLPGTAEYVEGQPTADGYVDGIPVYSGNGLVQPSNVASSGILNYDLRGKEPVHLTLSQRRKVNADVKALLEKNIPPDQLTEDQKNLIRQYTGEGGLSSGEGKGALNQHYTDYPVIAAIFDAIENSGAFEGKTDISALDPSTGSGNFPGFRPNYKWTTIDIDPTNVRVVNALYPQGEHILSPFELFKGSDYDLAITNVPFLEMRPAEGSHIRPEIKELHDFFFVHALDMLKDNGILAFITSKGTMNKQDPTIRQRLMDVSDVIGAYRLPQDTFEKNAQTSVTTDIIFLQKRPKGVEPTAAQKNINNFFVESTKNEDGFPLNNYYQAHPINILGEMSVDKNKMYGGKETLVVKGEADLSRIVIHPQEYKAQVNETESVEPLTLKKPLSLMKLSEIEKYAVDNGYYTRTDLDNPDTLSENVIINSDGSILTTLAVVTPKDRELKMKIYSPLDTTMPENNVISRKVFALDELRKRADMIQAGHGISESNIKNFIDSYRDIFTDVLPQKDRELKKFFVDLKEESLYRELASFINDDWTPKAVFTSKVRFTDSGKIQVDESTPLFTRALASEDYKGVIDLNKSEYVKTTDLPELLNTGYSVTGKNSVQNDILFYSGNIYQKITQTQNLLDKSSGAIAKKLRDQLSKLQEIKPEGKLFEDISISGNEKWVEQFRNIALPRYRTVQRKNKDGESYTAIEAGMGDVYDNYLNNQQLVSLEYKDPFDKSIHPLPEEERKRRIAEAEEEIKKVKDIIKERLRNNPDTATKVSEAYNSKFNNYVKPDYSKAVYLIQDVLNEIPTVGPNGKPFSLRKNQVDWVVKSLIEGKGINAHDVGGGKTFAAITLARALKKRGIAQKPMFVVPAKTITKWERDIKTLFPKAVIYNLGQLSKGERTNSLFDIANNEADYILISHEGFKNIKLNVRDELRYFEDVLKENLRNTENKGRALELELEKMKNFTKVIRKTERDTRLTFDKLGVDALVVDEAHAYKNIGIAGELVKWGAGTPFAINVRPAKVKAKDGEEDLGVHGGFVYSMQSARSYDFRFKAKYIAENNNGKNVFLLTATPTPNKPLEAFTMLRHLDDKILDEYGITTAKDFANQFLQFGSVNNPVKTKGFDNIITKITNTQELRGILDRFVDKLSMDKMPWIKLPTANVQTIFFRQSPDSHAVFEDIRRRMAERPKIPERGDDTMIAIYTSGRSASIDPRLYNSQHAKIKINSRTKNPETDKIEFTANYASNRFKANKDHQGIVFCDQAGHTVLVENIHREIKQTLIEKGLKPTEIAIISGQEITNPQTGKERKLSGDALNLAKQEIVDRYNNGDIKVIIGTSKSAGEGLDIQVNTAWIINMDIPYTPSEFIQRNGRGVRYGNKHDTVDILYLFTQGTFDKMSFDITSRKRGWNEAIWDKAAKNDIDTVSEMHGGMPSDEEIAIEMESDPVKKQILTIDLKRNRFIKDLDSAKSEIRQAQNQISYLNTSKLSAEKSLQDNLELREIYKEKIIENKDDKNIVDEYKKKRDRLNGEIDWYRRRIARHPSEMEKAKKRLEIAEVDYNAIDKNFQVLLDKYIPTGNKYDPIVLPADEESALLKLREEQEAKIAQDFGDYAEPSSIEDITPIKKESPKYFMAQKVQGEDYKVPISGRAYPFEERGREWIAHKEDGIWQITDAVTGVRLIGGMKTKDSAITEGIKALSKVSEETFNNNLAKAEEHVKSLKWHPDTGIENKEDENYSIGQVTDSAGNDAGIHKKVISGIRNNSYFDDTRIILTDDIILTWTPEDFLNNDYTLENIKDFANSKIKEGDPEYDGTEKYRVRQEGKRTYNRATGIGTVHFRRGTSRGTFTEELVHDLQARVSKISPKLGRRIQRYEAAVTEEARKRGVKVYGGAELFAKAFVAQHGYANEEVHAANLYSIPEQLFNDFLDLLNERVDESQPKLGDTLRGKSFATGRPEINITDEVINKPISNPGKQWSLADYLSRLEDENSSIKRVPAPIFFSKMERTLDSKLPSSFSSKQAMDIVRSGEIKAEEVKWSGIEQWLLDNRDKTITKKDLLDFVRGNELEIEEITHNGMDKSSLEFHEAGVNPDEQYAEDGIIPRGSKVFSVYYNSHSEYEIIRTDQGDYYILNSSGDPINERENPYSTLAGAINEANEDYAKGQTENVAKYSKYTLPGEKENYREMLFALPNKTMPTAEEVIRGLMDEYKISRDDAVKGIQNGNYQVALTREERNDLSEKPQFTSAHFNGPNVLAHTRVDDRTTSDGKNVLHIEEIQSDWHQKGRKEGYIDKSKALSELPKTFRALKQNDGDWCVINREDNRRYASSELTEKAAIAAALKRYNRDIVGFIPDAPYKKDWHEFMLKRLLRAAAEDGHDGITWNTGEQNSEMFDLRKQVSSIGYSWNKDGTYNISVHTPTQANAIVKDDITVAEIEKLVGKEIAQRIVDKKGEPLGKNLRTLSGLDLKIGGEGMKGFYDKIIPDFLNKYAKKWGAKVETKKVDTGTNGFANEFSDYKWYKTNEKNKVNLEIILNDGREYKNFDIPLKELTKYVDDTTANDIINKYNNNDPGGYEQAPYISSLKKAVGSYLLAEPVKLTETVHYLPITPEMRESVLYEGQPQFSVKPAKAIPEKTNYNVKPLESENSNLEVSPEILKKADEILRRPGAGESFKSLATKAIKAYDDFRKVFAPATRGPNAKLAAEITREEIAKMAHNKEMAIETLKGLSKHFDRLTNGQNLNIINTIENAGKQPSKELQDFSFVMRKLLDTAWEEVTKRNGSEAFIEDYFPHIWKDPEKARAVFSSLHSKKPLEGSKSFLKKRTLPLMQDGVDRDLIPVTFNPADLTLLKLNEMYKYIMAHDLISEYKINGLAKFVPIFKKTPQGWVKINDKIGTVYGNPNIPIKEAFDKLVMEGLNAAADNLGISRERKVKIGGRGDWGKLKDGKIITKFGGPESIIAHEIGHVLDIRYKLGDNLINNPEYAAEINALAKKRYEGQEVPEKFKDYVLKSDEKAAVLLEAYIHSPELFKKTAPKTFAWFDEFLKSDPDLEPLSEIKPSLVLGEAQSSVHAGGMVTRGHYYMPEEAATIINNYLSSGLAGNAIYDAYRFVGNTLNQAQLGLSGYHLTFTSIDAITSKFALGMREVRQGVAEKDIGKLGLGAFDAIRSVTPGVNFTIPVENIIKGMKLRAAYLQGTNDPELAEMVGAITQAGGRVKMDTFFKSGAYESLMHIIRSGTGNIGDIAKVPFALVDAVTKPLMEYIVPWQKLGVFGDLAKNVLEQSKLHNWDKDKTRQQLQKAWQSVDNRMGQMVYDNLFWNKTAKDLMMASVRSVGWNWGDISELGGGAYDYGKQSFNAAKGKKAEWTFKMDYVIAIPIVVGMLGAALSYLYGQQPEELKDLYFVRTGRKNPDGTDERISLPSYMKDVYAVTIHPVTMATNKLHPILSMIADMLSNRDYYGYEISDPQADKLTQAEQKGAYFAKGYIPFSIRNMIQRADAGDDFWDQAQSFVGITPAPKYITNTSLQNKIEEIFKERIGEPVRPFEDREKADAKKEIKKLLFTGKEDEADALIDKYVEAKVLTSGQTKDLKKNYDVPTDIKLFTRLPPSDKLSLLINDMSAKDVLRYFNKHTLSNLYDQLNERQLEKYGAKIQGYLERIDDAEPVLIR